MADHLAVWLSGLRAGTLERRRDGSIEFRYTSEYRHRRAAPALSVSMPRTQEYHGSDAAGPWFDNLLPDNDDVRQRWAADLELRRPTVFGLLERMGADCAGAVQVLPEGEDPTAEGAVVALNEGDIARHLRTLHADDSAWTFDEHGGRFSLGGQQGKFALTRVDGSWHQPTGRMPSTHIVKVGIAGLEGSDLAEHVTMRAAQQLGLRVAETHLETFEEQAAVIVRRFDRIVRDDGTISRLHQEDMCQARGLWRASKYEADGGPSVRELADTLDTAVDRRRLADAREQFASAVAFNWVAAGTDAHAKNFALLHAGSSTAFAPLYDVISAALLLDPHEVRFKSRLAMKLGGEYRLRAIGARHLVRAAADLGVEADWFIERVRALAQGLPDAVHDAVGGARRVVGASAGDGFVDRAATRSADVLRDLRTLVPEDRKQDDPDGRTWVEGHHRGDRYVPGFWRSRPGR